MNQNIRYYRSRPPRLTVLAGLVLIIGSQAYADVVGRLHFTVKNADDEKPVANASITLEDTAGVRAPISLTTGADGTATSPALETHGWKVTTKADTFDADTRTINVVADTTTEAEVLLEPLKENVIHITGQRNVTRPTDTSQDVRRDQSFIQKFPSNPSNRQSLTQFLSTTPGLAMDSVGQLHSRGEHASTTIYIDGFQLPGAFQGRFGQVLSPTAIQNVEVLTGGFAPEYGRETASILNVNLRAGTITPFVNYSLTGGSYDTFEGGITAGGQFGKEYGLPDENGRRARTFGYLIDVDARSTANALEPPQPADQTAHNQGQSYTSFGNFDWHISDRDSLSLLLSGNPAHNEVANRTGLPSFFAPYGQGYGYGGMQGPDSGLPSQQQDGQDVYQQDHNEFGVLNYLRTIDDRTQLRVAFGLIHNGIDILNNNPAVNLGALPTDNSIEYNPTLIRNARDAEGQASITHTAGPHTIKAGFSIDRQTGIESYQLTPASQAALNVLLSGDPTISTPDPTNPLYALRPDGGAPATVHVTRSGYYNAAYLQDTWRMTRQLTANYGLRLDDYTSDQTTQRDNEAPDTAHVGLQMVSPRFNFAYAVDPKTVLRASYDRLFIAPPTAQGAGIGVVIEPEKLNQYELSAERQTGPGQSVKVSGYYKEIRDQLDTGLLVPGTQIGAFVTDNIPKDYVRGLELAYNLVPVRPDGLSAYLSYAYAMAKPQGSDDPFNDHDQLHTLSTGLNYTFRTGDQAGLVFEYGSGFYSSVLTDGGTRNPHSDVNLRLASRPNLIGKSRLELNVENLFDDRPYLNFNSGFSGTRFQQGRRILLTLSGSL